MENCRILKIEPTIFLKRVKGAIAQMIRITVECDLSGNVLIITAISGGKEIGRDCFTPVNGVSILEFFIEELPEKQSVRFTAVMDDKEVSGMTLVINPPRHWTVHVAHLSHHDLGYSDLPSNVLKESVQHLNEALEYADQTDSYPDDSKFRIVIEQFWSLGHYLKNAPAEKSAKLLKLLREGRFEVTALYGNMITEICGHESLYRALYDSARLSRQYGVPVISAEHNDITGFSWGLCRALTDAEVKVFCPGIPFYYDWQKIKFPSCWDSEKLIGRKGPGAFWWEAPGGKKLLVWYNDRGCNGAADPAKPGYANPAMPLLEGWLEETAYNGYPYDTIRWPVISGMRDNSPYTIGFSDTIRDWNAKWAYPHLISSTNAGFYADFEKFADDSLPVWRGELPGQDYPSGATSTASATSVNRHNHTALLSAEKLASAAGLHTGHGYPGALIDDAYEQSLRHDEHTWGYWSPCGPAQLASECEKELTAYKAGAFAHEIAEKAKAMIADNLRLESGKLRLVVFNTTSWAKTAPVEAPMKELENCGSVMCLSPEKGVLENAVLVSRGHKIPAKEYLDGKFILMDDTGAAVPFEMTEITDYRAPEPYAPQRLGLGAGCDSEWHTAFRKNILFIARDVPPMGYRTYTLSPVPEPRPNDSAGVVCEDFAIENEFYRIEADPCTKEIKSIFDKTAGREIADTSAEPFYSLIVREGNSKTKLHEERESVRTARTGALSASMELDGSALGHPSIRHRITLYAGIKNIYLATSVLKDSMPMLNAHIGFPFAAKEASVRYESALSVIEPGKDILPGSYSDTLAVQNWARIQNGGYHILWSSLDAPIAGFGELRPGYVSPAHRGYMDESVNHPPQTAEDFTNGSIYSQLFYNYLGTNFSPTQTGRMLFRYVIGTGEGEAADSDSAKWGWQAVTLLETMFTDRPAPEGCLPAVYSFLQTDNDRVGVLNWKRAQDSDGYIVRLWNYGGDKESARVTFNGAAAVSACRVNACEEPIDVPCAIYGGGVSVSIPGREIAHIRVRLEKH